MTRARRATTPEQRKARLEQMEREHSQLPIPPGPGPLARQSTVARQHEQADREAYEREVAADRAADDYVRTYGIGGG